MPGAETGPVLKDKGFVIPPAAIVFGMRLDPGIVIRVFAGPDET